MFHVEHSVLTSKLFHVEHWQLYKMETLTNCLLCNTPLPVNPYITACDHLVSGETFNIVRCEKCTFLLTNPRPQADEIKHFYQSEAYISHTDKSRSMDDILYHQVKRFMLKRKLRLLKKHTTTKQVNILDFGCGTGGFLQAAGKAGFQAEGFEPGEVAKRVAMDKGLSLYENHETLFKKGAHKYDMITLWHVLEHIHDFPVILDKFYTLLADNSFLLIAIPMVNSYDAQHYKQFWAAYDVPRHLYHFSRKTIIKACKNAGFKLIDKQPMVFDSYYVSLLSEKHRGSKIPFLKAFYHGSVSNLNALFNKSPWSSEVFVFKKY